MDPYIVEVRVVSNCRLSIRFSDGESVVKDLKPLIAKGNLYADLKDEDFLKQVVIGARGRSLQWPNGLEFCADALRMLGEQQSVGKKKHAKPAVH